jgi:hypothetical protein
VVHANINDGINGGDVVAPKVECVEGGELYVLYIFYYIVSAIVA